MEVLRAAELGNPAVWPLVHERLSADPAGDAVLVEDPDAPAPPGVAAMLRLVPRVIAAVGRDVVPGTLGAAVDVLVADEAELAVVAVNPAAAAAMAVLLRNGDGCDVETALALESATYSALQAGPEHQRWLSARTRRARGAETGPAVRVERNGTRLLLTLARPHVRNAYDARMREELLAGLLVAAADDAITEVIVAGEGPAFCSGGDLDEFGTATDPAAAHLLRVGRSAGRAVHALAERVTVRVHGACVGAGVELPAFAGRVVAASDASFRLPEVAMGLVPGAGGTVSIPRRIGRQRTAWLALTGAAIDAGTALAWGLVDEVSEREDW